MNKIDEYIKQKEKLAFIEYLKSIPKDIKTYRDKDGNYYQPKEPVISFNFK